MRLDQHTWVLSMSDFARGGDVWIYGGSVEGEHLVLYLHIGNWNMIIT